MPVANQQATVSNSRPVSWTLVGTLVLLPVINAHIALPLLEHHQSSTSRLLWWTNIGFLVGVHTLLVASVVAVTQGPVQQRLGLVPGTTRRWCVVVGLVIVAVTIGLILRHVGAISGSLRGELLASDPTSELERAAFAYQGILVGACQEVLWRSFALRALRARGLGRVASIALTSASFAYYHGGVTQQPILAFVLLAIVAVFLAGLYHMRGDVGLPAALHAAFNGVGAVLL